MPALEDVLLTAPAPDERVDPLAWFDSPGPFELEIGCGKGGFLLSRARQRPDVRLLGVEWANKFCRYAADRVTRWKLSNVRLMRTDARQLVMRNLPSASVSILHLYHPDPWPKKRHHKRRLVQPDFAEAAANLLVAHGLWLVQSDHEEYFAQMRDVLGREPRLRSLEWSDIGMLAGPEWQGTNYEIKYAREGKPIYRAAFERLG